MANYEILSLRGKSTTKGNGMLGYDAEAELLLEDSTTAYASCSDDGANLSFDVTRVSWFEYLTGQDDELPEAQPTGLDLCDGTDEAEESEYRRVYRILYDMIRAIQGDDE